METLLRQFIREVHELQHEARGRTPFLGSAPEASYDKGQEDDLSLLGKAGEKIKAGLNYASLLMPKGRTGGIVQKLASVLRDKTAVQALKYGAIAGAAAYFVSKLTSGSESEKNQKTLTAIDKFMSELVSLLSKNSSKIVGLLRSEKIVAQASQGSAEGQNIQEFINDFKENYLGLASKIEQLDYSDESTDANIDVAASDYSEFFSAMADAYDPSVKSSIDGLIRTHTGDLGEEYAKHLRVIASRYILIDACDRIESGMKKDLAVLKKRYDGDEWSASEEILGQIIDDVTGRIDKSDAVVVSIKTLNAEGE